MPDRFVNLPIMRPRVLSLRKKMHVNSAEVALRQRLVSDLEQMWIVSNISPVRIVLGRLMQLHVLYK